MAGNSRLGGLRKKFIDEYIKDRNGTQAAIRAGYAPNSAGVTAAQLLAIPKIRDAVNERIAKVSAKAELTLERVLVEQAKLAFANMEDYLDEDAEGDPRPSLTGRTRDQMASIVEITVDRIVKPKGKDEEPDVVKRVKFRLADKAKVLEDLRKHLTEVGKNTTPDQSLDENRPRIIIEGGLPPVPTAPLVEPEKEKI